LKAGQKGQNPENESTSFNEKASPIPSTDHTALLIDALVPGTGIESVRC
jgi:hypothetical protein